MCGICGFVGKRDDDVLLRMRDALAHRGPDDATLYADDRVSLGHRRLSIVDLAGGRQPAFNADGSVALIFNGEIYNHPQLRREFEATGRRYATNSDTESIVHAYEAFGFDCPSRLDGMFAFVLFDRHRGVLFGARDRLGKKSLYYTVGTGGERLQFAFASEIKALRQHPAVAAGLQLSSEGLVSYLLNDYVLGSLSIFAGVHRLEPGHAFTFGLPESDRPGLRIWRYWDLDFAPSREPGSMTEQEAGRKVLELLEASVQRRLMADVPLGTFLSGGIDSSAIVAMLARLLPPKQIKTFSIGFAEPSFDESRYAARVATLFGTDHHERQFTVREMFDQLPAVTAMLDEPFADPSVLPVSLLCQFTRQHVTVALGGDGGDELFAGYDPFRAVRAGRVYRRLVPGIVHQGLIAPLARRLPSSDANMPFDFRVARFLRGATMPPALQLPTWMGPFSIDQLRRLTPGLAEFLAPERAYAPIIAAHDRLESAGPLVQALDYFERFYLPDDILVKLDRASMMHSLEARTPFLDTQLVEFVNGLSAARKYSRGRGKRLLKRALSGELGLPAVLPRDIVYRKKKGFGIPVARWIRTQLKDVFHDQLVSDWPGQLSMFERREIERLLHEHVAGAANHYKELWALFMLARWANEHFC